MLFNGLVAVLPNLFAKKHSGLHNTTALAAILHRLLDVSCIASGQGYRLTDTCPTRCCIPPLYCIYVEISVVSA